MVVFINIVYKNMNAIVKINCENTSFNTMDIYRDGMFNTNQSSFQKSNIDRFVATRDLHACGYCVCSTVNINKYRAVGKSWVR